MSLYQRILAASFDSLEPILQRLHDLRSTKRYAGYCDIESDDTLMARIVAKVAGLPGRSVSVPVTLTMNCKDGSEEWVREFGSHEMRSVLEFSGGRLRERLGLVVFTFDLKTTPNRIDWHLVTAKLWPIPIPITPMLKCSATEAVVDGRYTFEVKGRVRGVGMVVHYRGWLAES
jgi:uncharacterized protein DUF4166